MGGFVKKKTPENITRDLRNQSFAEVSPYWTKGGFQYNVCFLGVKNMSGRRPAKGKATPETSKTPPILMEVKNGCI